VSGLRKRTFHTAIPAKVRNTIVGIALLCASLSATAAYADFPQPVIGDQYTIEQMLTASSQVNGDEMSIDGWTTDADGFMWTVENDSLGGTLGTSRLVKRMPNGTILQTYGMGMNPSAGDLWDARAVAIHPSTGDIYVADSLNNRIAIYRHDDAFYLGSHGGPVESALTTITDEPYGLTYPSDLEFDTEGNLYVVDRDNNRVVKYDATLTFVTAFGIAGGQDVTDRTQNLHGGFYSPSGISIDASSNVWVADAWNNRIEKFSPGGTWLDSLRPAKAGGAEDEFQTPLDVTVDGYGTIYVADSPGWAPFSSGRFSRWGAQKDPLGQYGDQKPLGGAIILPSKLTVDSWGGVSINDNDPYDTAPGVLERWGLNAGEPDVTPPVTTTDASSSWVNSVVSAHLQAIDASSPVVGTYWSSDGSTPTAAYEGSITVSAEGTTTLRYFSVDRPGNAEAVKSHIVRIDYNAPISQSSIVSTYYGQAVISLTATDALSGAQDIWYRLDGGSPTLGGVVIVNIQGPHHLEYWAEDAAGNKESHHAQVFTVMPDDADPPITYWAQYSPDWFRANPQITLMATDTVSGVASTHYSMNGSAPATYTGSFSWSQEGTTTMQFWSVDNLGHVEATQTDLIRVDKGAPTSWADVPTGAIGNATVRFYATDSVSGVSTFKWSLNGTDWFQGDSAFIPTYGNHTLRYYAIDNAGNAETQHFTPVTVLQPDFNAPDTTSNVPLSGWVKGPYPLQLDAVDDISGVQASWYDLDDAGWTTWAPNSVWVTDGIHSVKFYSVDNRGNVEATHTATLKVDSGAPFTSTDAQPVYAGATTIHFYPTDALSTTQTYYRVDTNPVQSGTSVALSEFRSYTLEYWSVDDAGNEEDHHTISVAVNPPDNVPPVTTFTGPSGWQKGYALFSLSAVDASSTVKYIFYSLNGSYDVPYSNPVNVSTEGTNTVKYHAVDFFNNVETSKTAEIKVDASPPVTTSDAVENYTEQAPITFAPTDAYSGVATTHYRVNGGAWQQGTFVNILWSKWRRYHTVDWYSVDAVGNIEATKTATVAVRLNSQTYPSSDPNIVYRDNWYTTAGGDSRSQNASGSFALISFQGTRFDLLSRVGPNQGKMRVSLVDSSTMTSEVDLYDSVNRDGNNIAPVWTTGDIDFNDYIVKVEWLGTRNPLSGGTEINIDDVKTEGSITEVPDTEAPTTTHNAPAGWVDGPVSVTLSSTDATTGVSAIYAALDATPSVGSTYTAPVSVVAEGTHAVKFFGVDRRGNAEAIKSATVKVDNTAPVTNSNALPSYVGTASVSLFPSDIYSGLAYTKWRVDGAAWTNGTAVSVPASALGAHVLEWYSVDNLGHAEATKTASLRVLARTEQTDARITYRGSWTTTSNASHSAGTVGRTSGPAPAAAYATFRGTSVDLIAQKASSFGIAEVSLDGAAPVDVDLYSASTAYKTVAWSAVGLADTTHTVSVTYSGRKNAASSGTTIDLDAIDVGGTLVADTAPPVTTSSVGSSAWRSGTETVTLSAVETDTYVATTYYRINGGTLTAYTGPFPVAAEGTNTVNYYSVDGAGNTEATKTATVRIDDTAPVSSDNAPTGWVDGPVSVTLSSVDPLSGVSGITYRLDGAAPQTYATPVAITTEGTHTLTYQATDVVGNVEGVRTVTVRIDNTAPVSSDDAPSGWVDGPVIVTLTPADPVSGVNALLYSIDGSEPTVPYTTPLVIAAQGITTIKYAAIDIKGNIEPTKTTIVSIDDVAPVTSDNAPSAWVNGPVDVTLVADDLTSGVAQTRYVLDGGPLTSYAATSPITITAEGTHTIEYASTDVKGNTETTKTATVRIDDTAPVSGDDAPTGWVDGPVSVTLSSVDPLSGVSGITYRLDGAAPQTYATPVAITTEGTHTLTYQATDVVGNVEGVRTVTVRIDNTAPVSSDDAPSGWVDGPVIVTLTPADPVSGVNALLYSIDGSEPTVPYTTPLVIAAQGITTIKYAAIDIKGNIEPTKTTTVSIDDVAPVTADNAPSAWVNGPVHVTLLADDVTSGVAQTRYVLDGGPLTSYAATSPITISAEGTHTLEYASTDVKGNIETTKTATVRIDDTAPVSSDNAPSGWVDGPVNVALSSIDPLSGVSGITYRLDGAAPQTYATPVAITTEGTHTLTYQATDAVGNVEDVRTVTVRIDNTAPVSSDDAPSGWVDGPVIVTLLADDLTSGVARTDVVLDGAASVYTEPLHISAEGTHTIQYSSTDVKGNTESTKTATVRIDNTAPVSSDDAPSGWVDGPVIVTLTPADPVSGVNALLYSIDGSEPTVPYTTPLVIAAQGVTTIKYAAIDIKGNIEPTKTTTVSIDDVAPVTSDNAPSAWVNGPVHVTLLADDVTSGVAQTRYVLDGGPLTSYAATSPVTITAEGTHTIEYASTDVKGNTEATKTATVRIDDTAPQTLSNALPSYDGTAVVTFTPNDPYSGVAKTQYCIDGGPWIDATTVTISGAGTYSLDWRSVDVVGNVEDTRSAMLDVTKRFEQTDSRVLFRGAWSNSNNANHSAGSWRFASATAATAYVLFDGTRLDLIGARGPSYGQANLRIDGGEPVALDYYAATYQFNQVLHSFKGLTPGRHILTIELLGSHSASSTGNFGGLDAVDVVGTLYADTTPPASSHVAPVSWQNTTSTVSLNASDTQTWVAQTRYRINTGIQYTYNAPVAVGAEGTNTVTYFSTDGAGNVEPLQTTYVRIDRTAPLTADDAPAGWSAGDVDVRLAASDALSGISTTVYSLDGSEFADYTGAISLNEEGVHTLNYRSSDIAGNEEATRTATIRIDATAPETTDDAPTGWIGGGADVALTATDDASGLSSTSYCIGDGEWTPYTTPITISSPGVTTIKYRSTDQAGNSEAVKTTTIRIDGVAPVTTSDAPAAWTAESVQLTLSAEDAVNAVEATYFRIDGGEQQLYTGPIPFTSEGTSSVQFWSTDTAGNVESPQSVIVRIDRTAPATTDDAPSEWRKDAVTVSLTAHDSLSGTVATMLSVDGGDPVEYSAPISISGEGTHTIDYRTTDAAGNQESTRTAVVRIDGTSPVTEHDVRDSYLASATITLTPIDSQSGVAGTEWSLDEGAWQNGTAIAVDTTGTHTLRFRSADVAGNLEDTHMKTFTLSERFEQTAGEIGYSAAWKASGFNGFMSDGTYHLADTADSTAIIRFSGTRLRLVTTTSSGAGIASVSMDGTGTTDVDLYSPKVGYQQNVWDSGLLATGEHTVTVSWTGRKNPASAGTVIGIDALDVAGHLLPVTMEAPLASFEQDDSRIAYSGPWSTSNNGFHSGGSYLFSKSATGSANIKFNGERLVLSGATNNSFGIASLALDGKPAEDVDFYSPAVAYKQNVWDSGKLASGEHTLTLTWTGRKNPSSSGTAINIDSLSIGGTLQQAVPSEILTPYEQSERQIVYEGTWGTSTNGFMSGGNYRYSNAASSTVTMSFVGTKLEWVTARSNSFGNALVSVDGGAPVVVDLYAPTIQYQQTVFTTGTLADGRHTVSITCAGSRNASSTGNNVGIDKINVVGTIAAVRSEQTHPRIAYDGTWSTSNNGNMSGGSYAFSGASGSANVAFNGTSIAWVTAKNNSFGKANVLIDGDQVAEVDLYSPTVQYQQTVWESPVLADGSHTLKIEWTGTKNSASSGTFVGVDALECAGYLTPRRFEQTDGLVSQVGTWTTGVNGSMSGGSYLFANSAGAVANFTFRGTRFDWVTIKNNAMGIANVSLDGGAPVPVDLYSPTTQYKQAVWSSGTLSSGTHTVSVTWTGTKNPASTGTNVGIDAVDVVGSLTLRRYEQTAPGIAFTSGWANSNNALHSAGSYQFASSNGATATVSFWGKRLDWITIKSPAMGIAAVAVDGGQPQLVDLYSAATQYQQTAWTSGVLANGPHTVTITRTGTKATAATNYYVGVDSVDISGVLTP